MQVHWPVETLLYASELFPLTQQKSPVCCVIIPIVNAWTSQCATWSLSAPELRLPVYIPDLYAVFLQPLLSLKYLELNSCQCNRFRFINILDVSVAAVDYFHVGLGKDHSVYFNN